MPSPIMVTHDHPVDVLVHTIPKHDHMRMIYDAMTPNGHIIDNFSYRIPCHPHQSTGYVIPCQLLSRSLSKFMCPCQFLVRSLNESMFHSNPCADHLVNLCVILNSWSSPLVNLCVLANPDHDHQVDLYRSYIIHCHHQPCPPCAHIYDSI